jgi:RNA polymerase sigma-70 factor (ECF subfamily)
MTNAPFADSTVPAVDGDVGAFAALVRRHAGPLLRLVTRVEGDRRLAEAVVHNAFVAAWADRDRFDPFRSFKLWLYRLALARGRAADVRRPAPGSPSPPAAADPALAAVDRLPPRQRAVVLLRVWEDLSYDEIGFVLAVTEGSARSEMYYALAALRNWFRHAP